LDVLATLQQQQVDALQALQTEVLNTLPTLPTAAQLSLLNQRATTMEALLLDVKNLLNNSRLLSTNSYPLLKLFTVPTYPAVLAIRLPSDTTSYSISLISLPSLPDTLNSYAVYDLALESTPAPPAEPPCPCLSTALPIEQWYPLFWGTEETQDNLALPDSLVLRITVTGASQNAQLALKLWSRTVPQVQSSVGTING
jgi:hypothetical protein